MPYLEPEEVLREFARFTRAEVRPAVADDEEFVRAQVGSMASTLGFLSGELAGREAAVERQRRVLLEALDGVEAALEDGPDAPGVREAVADARERLRDAEGSPGEREEAATRACEDVLAAVDDRLDGERGRAARRPLYDFLDARVESQLRMLGREGDP